MFISPKISRALVSWIIGEINLTRVRLGSVLRRTTTRIIRPSVQRRRNFVGCLACLCAIPFSFHFPFVSRHRHRSVAHLCVKLSRTGCRPARALSRREWRAGIRFSWCNPRCGSWTCKWSRGWRSNRLLLKLRWSQPEVQYKEVPSVLSWELSRRIWLLPCPRPHLALTPKLPHLSNKQK